MQLLYQCLDFWIVDEALILTQEYLEGVRMERNNAEEAIQIVQDILSGEIEEHRFSMKRKEVSEYLDISMDTLRNWEMNGLLTVKRKENGYRVYTDEDIKRLKIIRSLRCAKYSCVRISASSNFLCAESLITEIIFFLKPPCSTSI